MAWLRCRRKRKKVWRVASLSIVWTIWREQSWRTFENKEQTDQKLKHSILCNVYKRRLDTIDLFCRLVGFLLKERVVFCGIAFEAYPFGAQCRCPIYFGVIFFCYLYRQYLSLPFKKGNFFNPCSASSILHMIFGEDVHVNLLLLILLLKRYLWLQNDEEANSISPLEKEKHRSNLSLLLQQISLGNQFLKFV